MPELTDLERRLAYVTAAYGQAKGSLNRAKRRLTAVASLIPRLEAGALDLLESVALLGQNPTDISLLRLAPEELGVRTGVIQSLIRELKRLCRAEIHRPVSLPAHLQRKDACFRIRREKHRRAALHGKLRLIERDQGLRRSPRGDRRVRQHIARDEGLLAGLAEVKHG